MLVRPVKNEAVARPRDRGPQSSYVYKVYALLSNTRLGLNKNHKHSTQARIEGKRRKSDDIYVPIAQFFSGESTTIAVLSVQLDLFTVVVV
jgi:hypothetical protein